MATRNPTGPDHWLMSTHTIKIGDEEYTLRGLSADKALRIIDLAADSTEELQAVMQNAADWRRRYEADNTVNVTPDAFDDPEVAAQLEAAGYTRERVEEAGSIQLPLEPSEIEVFSSILPGAYKVLRDPILTACAILLAPGEELLDAEDEGTLDDYLAQWRRKIRSEATVEQIAELIWAGWEFASGEILGSGLGKMMGRFRGSPEEPATKTQSPAKPKPRTSSRSRATSTGRGAKSS